MPVNSSRIHSVYLLAHPMPTGAGCIRNVARFLQLPNLSHISLQVSITSNNVCLKTNSLVHCIVLSSLSLLSDSSLLLSDSSLLSDSDSSFSLLYSLLSDETILLSSFSLLSISSLLSVSTQPALLAYTMFLLLRSKSELLSDS